MKFRPRDRLAIGAVVLLATVGAYYMLALKPQRQKAASLQAAITKERTALAQAEQSFTAGREAQASLKASATEWAALKLALPGQSDIPGLLRTLQRNAEAAHVHMQAISLAGAGTTGGAPTAPSPAPSSTSGAPGSSAGAAPATEVPVQLTFNGGYAALNRLVQQLDSFVVISGKKVHASGPLMTISNVGLNSGQGLTVQLTATIYQLQPAPATGATGGATATTTPTTGGK